MPTQSTHAVASPVVDMLKADHKKVKGLFEEYKTADPRKKQEIAKTAIPALEIHAALEERLIYPAIRGPKNRFVAVCGVATCTR